MQVRRDEVFLGRRFAAVVEALELGDVQGAEARVGAAQLQAIENQLFALARQQSRRNQPIDLPRPDFWSQVSTLLTNIEMELAEVGRVEGWSVKAQNLSRRQANVRRAVTDLTQHRLTSFVRYATTSNLTSPPFGDAVHESKAKLAPLDWSRQDVSERAFYEGLGELIERYKRNVSWDQLQHGMSGGEKPIPTIQAGTPQLDSYVEDSGGLTGDGPPQVEVIEKRPASYEEPDEDEEVRISRMEAYPTSGSKRMESRPEESDDVEPSLQVEDELEESMGKLRIRMLQDLPAPIVDGEGNELELLSGDVEFCDADFASGLIAAGLAEEASA